MGNISKAELKRRLAQQKRDLLNASRVEIEKISQDDKEQLQRLCQNKRGNIIPVVGQLAEYHRGFLVHNWRDYWKWFSSWAFIAIMFFATVPIPPELLDILPEHVRQMVIALVALAGLILRFVNQTKPKFLANNQVDV